MSFFDLSMRALLRRELMATFRSVRAWLILSCCVAGPLAAVYFALRGGITPDNAQAVSAMLFGLYVATLLVGSSLMVPALAAISVTTEREKGTFDALQSAPITPGQIVVAKTLGVFAFYLFWFMATLPLAGVVFFLVGVDAGQFTQAAVTTTLTALCCAVIGVALSVRSDETRYSIGMSYVFMFVLHGVPQLLVGALLTLGVAAILLWPLFMLLSPAAVAMRSLEGFAPWSFAASTVYQLLVIYFGLRYARGILRRPDIRRSFETPKKRRETLRLADEAPARRRSALQRLMDLSGGRQRLFAYGIVVYMMLSLAAIPTASLGPYITGSLTPFLLQGLLPLLVLPGAMARHFTSEHERGTFDLLAMTSLTPTELLYLQLRAGLHAMKPFLLAMAVGSLPILAIPFFKYGNPGVTLWSILVYGLHKAGLYTSLLAGLAAALFLTQTMSLFTRRSFPALALCVSGLIALLVCSSILTWAPAWLFYGTSPWFYVGAVAVQPLGLITLINGLFVPTPEHRVEVAAVWAGGLLFHAAVCGGLFLLSKRLLSRRHLRCK